MEINHVYTRTCNYNMIAECIRPHSNHHGWLENWFYLFYVESLLFFICIIFIASVVVLF